MKPQQNFKEKPISVIEYEKSMINTSLVSGIGLLIFAILFFIFPPEEQIRYAVKIVIVVVLAIMSILCIGIYFARYKWIIDYEEKVIIESCKFLPNKTLHFDEVDGFSDKIAGGIIFLPKHKTKKAISVPKMYSTFDYEDDILINAHFKNVRQDVISVAENTILVKKEVEKEITKTQKFFLEMLVLITFLGITYLFVSLFNNVGTVNIFLHSLSIIIFWLCNFASVFLFYVVFCFRLPEKNGDNIEQPIDFLFSYFGVVIFGIGLMKTNYCLDYFLLQILSIIFTLILIFVCFFVYKINSDKILGVEYRGSFTYKSLKTIFVSSLIYGYSFFTIAVANQMYSHYSYIEAFDIISKFPSKDFHILEIKNNQKTIFPHKELKVHNDVSEAKEVKKEGISTNNDKLIIHTKIGLFGIPFLAKYE